MVHSHPSLPVTAVLFAAILDLQLVSDGLDALEYILNHVAIVKSFWAKLSIELLLVPEILSPFPSNVKALLILPVTFATLPTAVP